VRLSPLKRALSTYNSGPGALRMHFDHQPMDYLVAKATKCTNVPGSDREADDANRSLAPRCGRGGRARSGADSGPARRPQASEHDDRLLGGLAAGAFNPPGETPAVPGPSPFKSLPAFRRVVGVITSPRNSRTISCRRLRFERGRSARIRWWRNTRAAEASTMRRALRVARLRNESGNVLRAFRSRAAVGEPTPPLPNQTTPHNRSASSAMISGNSSGKKSFAPGTRRWDPEHQVCPSTLKNT
jgi:hypothetical protein